MSKRVESEQYYVTFEMFVADAKRMFANARTYNSPDTIYYKCATRYGSASTTLPIFVLFYACFWFQSTPFRLEAHFQSKVQVGLQGGGAKIQ